MNVPNNPIFFASRRRFLQSQVAHGAAVLSMAAASGVSSSGARTYAAESVGQWPIAIFEKVFEDLNYQELADALVQVGADGVEATIRPGGHIEPEAAEDEVPKMVAALQQRGKKLLIAATHIASADEPTTEPLLKALKSNGIYYYRMKHYFYDLQKPMLPQLKEFNRQIRDLSQLNRQLGLQGLYQNHSGGSAKQGYVGALGVDVPMLLDGIEPKLFGLAFDTRHLRKDTGSSWQTSVAACKPHIRSIYVKDGIWEGPRGDQYRDVPLDTGFVNQGVFDTMRAGLEPMPLSIHMEWLGYRRFKRDEIQSAIDANRRDTQTLRKWISTS
ncbi:MAG: hypothetical protein KDB03_10260 [Planctomycetales bacterium]|nr:hypothetical protein [Planctomycetales bacterium]